MSGERDRDPGLDAALEAARPAPDAAEADARSLEDIREAGVYSGDYGAVDPDGPAANREVGPGVLVEPDPNPMNEAGTRGMESDAGDVPHSSREIPGASSGDPQRIGEVREDD